MVKIQVAYIDGRHDVKEFNTHSEALRYVWHDGIDLLSWAWA